MRLACVLTCILLSFGARAEQTEWPMVGNGPDHQGYAPVTLGAGNFNLAWDALIEPSRVLQPLAVADGKVFVTPKIYFNDTYLSALDQWSGIQQWRYNFNQAHGISGPSYDSGRVYVMRGYHTDDSQVWSFNASTGQVLQAMPFQIQWDEMYPPTIGGGTVYICGGTYGGLRGFDQATGAQRFSLPLEQRDAWTPAYHNNKVYTFVYGKFREHDPLTGAIGWTVPVATDSSIYTAGTCPVLKDLRGYVAGSSHISCVDTVSKSLVWKVAGSFTGTPCVANSVVYVISGQTVKALSILDGAIVQTYVADTNLHWQPIVTDDALIVSSTSATYVFKLGTAGHTQKIAHGGFPALVNKSLYLACSDGYVRKFTQNGSARPNITAFTSTPASPKMPASATLSVTASDSDGPNPLTYNFGKVAGPGTVMFSPESGTSNTTSATFSAPGGYTLRVIVSDGESTRVATLTLNVKPEFEAPTISAFNSNPNPVKLPQTASLSVSATDPDTAASGLTYTFSKVVGAGAVTFSTNASTSSSTTATFGSSGDYTLRVSLTDGVNTTTRDLLLTVKPQFEPPAINLITASALRVPVSTASTLQASVSDPDTSAAALSFSWSKVSGPGTAAFSPASTVGNGSTSVTFDQAGVYVVRLSLSDGVNLVTRDLKMVAHSPPLPTARTQVWPMFGNNPAHTGFCGGNIGETVFTAGWLATVATTPLRQPAVAEGKVFVTPKIYFNSTFAAAYNIGDGLESWRRAFNTAYEISPPAYDSGRVYVQRGNHSSDSQLYSLVASNGQVAWSTPFSCQWETYFSPTIANGNIYVNGGSYGGMYGFDQATGTQRFFNSSLEQYDEWTPAFYNGKIYSFVQGRFRQHHPLTGAIEWTLDLGWNWSGYAMNRVAAFSDNRAFLVGNPDIYAIDLATRQVVWTDSGTFTGSPAVADGVVYFIRGQSVRAYDAATGIFIATYQANSNLQGQPIVLNDGLIVASSSKTYIFRFDNSDPVQTIDFGGEICLAGRHLYIATSDGKLRQYSQPGQAPLVPSQTAAVVEDTAKAVALSAVDPDGDVLSFAVTTPPAHGTLSGTAPNLTYTPAPDFHGSDSFTFTASDGTLETNGTVTLNVSPVNDAPTAVNVNVSTQEDTAASITLSGADIDGDALQYVVLQQPQHGSLSGTGASLTYTPDEDYNGSDSFSYEVSDGSLTATATVSIGITPVNDAPAADDLTAAVFEDASVLITLSGSDIEGSPLTFKVLQQPQRGTLSGAAPNLTYTPAPDFSGTDTFTYAASDGAGFGPAASATITVVPINDRPSIVSGPIVNPNPATVSTPVTFQVTAADADHAQLIIEWSFGDGTTASGSSVTHAYAVPGEYTASVVVRDSASASVTSSVIVKVAAPAAPPPPAEPPAEPLRALAVQKLSGGVSFVTTGKDWCSISGVISDVPASFKPEGAQVKVDLGGAVAEFQLDARGGAKTPNVQFKLKLPKNFNGGSVPFTLKLKGGTWSDEWADEGVTSAEATNHPLILKLLLTLQGYTFSGEVGAAYSCRPQVSGKMKK